MKILKQDAFLCSFRDSDEILRRIEDIGRVSYRSWDKDPDGSKAKDFVRSLIKRGHESVLEHVSLTAEIFCDRGVSHELVRHRIASFTQESTRYCNYANDKFGNELTFISPADYMTETQYHLWLDAMQKAEEAYLDLIKNGASPQIARSVLPNSLATRVVMTANLREWRHFFRLRCAKNAHPQMREVACMLLNNARDNGLDVIFEDIVKELRQNGEALLY